jgi:DNA-binding XRE family transcriptional regulator/predicted GIY-YIG superfamily endonuclease
MTWYVYALSSPRDGVIRYIGKSDSPADRLHSHCSKSAAQNVKAWVEALGCDPALVIVGRFETEPEAQIFERNEIARLKANGVALLNRHARKVERSPRKHRFTGIAGRALQTRLERGMTQDDLANAAGIGRSIISHVESGLRTHLSAEIAVLIARALGVTVEWLITGEGASARKVA